MTTASFRKGIWVAMLGAVMGNVSLVAHASGIIQNVSGQLRMYYFTRKNSGNKPVTTDAFSLGGNLHADTKSWNGISAGATFYDASSLGLNDQNKADTSLPSTNVTAIGEAYLKYANAGFGTLKGGNQLYKSPWANPSDSRIIPAAFQGVAYDSPAFGPLQVGLARMYQWKNRTASTFDRTNLYSATGADNPGFLSASVSYNEKPLSGSAWYYRFYDIADLIYLDGKGELPIGNGLKGVLGVQYAHESDTGASLLGSIDSQVYGLLAGVTYGPGTVSLGYNHIASNSSAYGGGDLVSPYTGGYATDPLYTTSMTQGALEQKAAGNAWKLKGVWWAMGHSVRAIASYASYHVDRYTHPDQTGNPWEVDADVTYFPTGTLKGLSLRDRLGMFTYPGAPERFFYNRVMLQYNF